MAQALPLLRIGGACTVLLLITTAEAISQAVAGGFLDDGSCLLQRGGHAISTQTERLSVDAVSNATAASNATATASSNATAVSGAAAASNATAAGHATAASNTTEAGAAASVLKHDKASAEHHKEPRSSAMPLRRRPADEVSMAQEAVVQLQAEPMPGLALEQATGEGNGTAAVASTAAVEASAAAPAAADAAAGANDTTVVEVKQVGKDKALLLVIEMFPPAWLLGIDRFYLGSFRTGIAKVLVSIMTLSVGGFIWGLIDFCIIIVNALCRSKALQTFGMDAQFFSTQSCSLAFVLALIDIAMLPVWIVLARYVWRMRKAGRMERLKENAKKAQVFKASSLGS